MQVKFWKFVSHPVQMTYDDAKKLAERIERGEVTPTNQHGERYYRIGGWAFDIGRKPYLVEHDYGNIERRWALCVGELRRACYLSRKDRVKADPFLKVAC